MLSILRIMVGLLYMEHGLAKILDFPHQPTHAPYALLTLNPGLQGLLELVGGLLLTLGLFTRCVGFVLAGDMAVAYFLVHAPRGFFPLLNGGELAIVYCFIFLYFWLRGGGEWSIDRLRRRGPRAARVGGVAQSGRRAGAPPREKQRVARGGGSIPRGAVRAGRAVEIGRGIHAAARLGFLRCRAGIRGRRR